MIERARVLRATVRRDLPRDYDALAQQCFSWIDKAVADLQALQDDRIFPSPLLDSERLRAFKRVVSDLDALETFGIAALSRATNDDHKLNILIDRIRREIHYPFVSPVVTTLSQQYFCIDTSLNLLGVPLTEGMFLLHLPDLYHELAHPLAQVSNDPRIEPFQAMLGEAIAEAILYIASELQKEERKVGPQQPRHTLKIWEHSWVKYWMEEFFCDLFAAFTLGPAYAWSHLHLSAKRGDDAYSVPVYVSTSHPPDDARMAAILMALRIQGFETHALSILSAWNRLNEHAGVHPEPEYFRCFPSSLIEMIVTKAEAATKDIGCRLATPSTASTVHTTLNEAWDQFWQFPADFVAWERHAVDTLFSVLAGVK